MWEVKGETLEYPKRDLGRETNTLEFNHVGLGYVKIKNKTVNENYLRLRRGFGGGGSGEEWSTL